MNSSITKCDKVLPGGPEASAEERPAALLRGSARGLEIVVDGGASIDAIAAAICTKLAEAPGFFRGSDVHIRVDDGPLAAGCLARLDEIAARFELRIVEIGAAKKKGAATVDAAVPQLPTLSALAQGSAPASAPPELAALPKPAPIVVAPASVAAPAPIVVAPAPVAAPAPIVVAPAPIAVAAAPAAASPQAPAPVAASSQAPAPVAPPAAPTPQVAEVLADPETRLLIGPVRSGVVLAHDGHLIIFGDVNPGAEVRATGNIVVLGRLKGTAHAGIGRDVGFILALHLQPQQLRICRLVARAGDSDTPSAEAEIAHATNGTIVVERYLGKLHRSLADSLS
jgi:septum site-determining protein MinC